MFQAIRYRLLVSYLGVMAAILGVFVIAVRVVFTHSLNQRLTEQLIALAQGATTSLELENGRLGLQSDFPVKSLIDRDQGLEWFSTQRQSIGRQGRYNSTLPFAGANTEVIEIQPGTPGLQAVTLPIINPDNGDLLGYVRASQSLAESEETLRKLDLGLGGGFIMALLMSGVGGAILTRQAMHPIEQSFERLQQFTADASHELRSPLMAITANVDVALAYPEQQRSTGDAQKFAAIASAASQMTRLTEDLLFLARYDHLPQHQQQTLDLATILDELVSLYQPQAQQKNISLTINQSNTLDLIGDREQLKRLFTNLIVNAIQYTPEGGQIRIERQLTSKQIIVSLKDTGIGIAPEQQARVFERFWQADNSRSYTSGGSGLGLAIAQAIASSHRGVITLTSQRGQGSCFTVYLPAKV